ncbi:MAG: 4'-phosphopantetheinyl transferase superfamily protein [Myxococcales bacterium]|nr:MAG: 4'-phosphopantetheinyl transferase superfamily protein [Myxococcales bacterium]
MLALEPASLLVPLGPGITSAGFQLGDHEQVIAELGSLVPLEGLSQSAVAKRRAEYMAGRYAARRALAGLGIDGAPGRDERGCPVWPSGIAGSITHGASRAFSAVARASDVLGVGIDAEQLMSARAKDELLARICDADERTILTKLHAPEPALVTFAFSAKESLYKCLYPFIGRFMDFSAARVVEASGAPGPNGLEGELELELSVDWSESFRRGRRFRAPFVASAHHVETGVVLRP